MIDESGGYRLYLDDSGTKEYADDPAAYSKSGGKSRYFVFGGFLAHVDALKGLHQQLLALKRIAFGTELIEVKANWLSYIPKRKSKYLGPYNMEEETLKTFEDLFYKAVTDADLTIFAAIVDKPQQQQAPGIEIYPPALSYEYLMQRVVQHLKPPHRIKVIIDHMDGATPYGNQYRVNLERQHKKLRKHGSRPQQHLNFAHLRDDVLFLDSRNSQFLQVADLIAYGVYKQFNEHGEKWENPEKDAGGVCRLPICDRLEPFWPKFCQSPDGRVQGYGLVKTPMLKQVFWKAEKEV